MPTKHQKRAALRKKANMEGYFGGKQTADLGPYSQTEIEKRNNYSLEFSHKSKFNQLIEALNFYTKMEHLFGNNNPDEDIWLGMKLIRHRVKEQLILAASETSLDQIFAQAENHKHTKDYLQKLIIEITLDKPITVELNPETKISRDIKLTKAQWIFADLVIQGEYQQAKKLIENGIIQKAEVGNILSLLGDKYEGYTSRLGIGYEAELDYSEIDSWGKHHKTNNILKPKEAKIKIANIRLSKEQAKFIELIGEEKVEKAKSYMTNGNITEIEVRNLLDLMGKEDILPQLGLEIEKNKTLLT